MPKNWPKRASKLVFIGGGFKTRPLYFHCELCLGPKMCVRGLVYVIFHFLIKVLWGTVPVNIWQIIIKRKRIIWAAAALKSLSSYFSNCSYFKMMWNWNGVSFQPLIEFDVNLCQTRFIDTLIDTDKEEFGDFLWSEWNVHISFH